MKNKCSSLSRIETNVIFFHLQNEKMRLYIKRREKSFFLETSEYMSENRLIILKRKDESLAEGETVYVYFLYKKVKVFFKSILEKKELWYFTIPETFYLKKKKKKSNTFPSLSLYHKNLLLSTFLSANFNQEKEKFPTLSKSEVQTIFARSQHMGHNLKFLMNELKRYVPEGENLYSYLYIINKFLIKKERGKLKEKNLYILSDSNVILTFSSIKFARQFACPVNKHKELSAKISFKNRDILCNVQYDFFSPFLKQENTCDYGFLGLKISNIQEEDKRYLYEGIFLNIYGSYFETTS